MTCPGLADQRLLFDAEPVVKPIGEGQGGAETFGKGRRVGRDRQHDNFGARQGSAQGDRREHAERPVAGDDDPLGQLARFAHGTAASRRALAVRNSRCPGIAATSLTIALRSPFIARATCCASGSCARESCRSGQTPWPR